MYTELRELVAEGREETARKKVIVFKRRQVIFLRERNKYMKKDVIWYIGLILSIIAFIFLIINFITTEQIFRNIGLIFICAATILFVVNNKKRNEK